jgi:hypothetical protein
MRFVVAFASLALTLFAASPAQAQSLSSVSEDGVRRMVVYGSDPCPQTSPDEIVICARRPDSDRYRIPERFRTPDKLTGDHEAWAYRAEQLELVGAGGIGSCSTVGPGGAMGCFQQLLEQAKNERRKQAEAQRDLERSLP